MDKTYKESVAYSRVSGCVQEMRNTTCRICEEPIDKSACGQAFTIVTVKDDRANSTKKYKEERFYLCDSCTASLAVFVNTKILERLEVVTLREG